MLEIVQTSTFKKHFKKYRHQKIVLQELEKIIDILASEGPIPAKYKNHKLTGNYVGMMELHLRPDDLLIYIKVERKNITLMALGSHSELFGK